MTAPMIPPTTPRIPLARIEDLSPVATAFVARRGQLNVFRLLANAPRVFDGWTRMVDALLDSDTVPVRLRELVILRVAHLQRCRYELAQHSDLARRVGIPDPDIAAATGDAPMSGSGLVLQRQIFARPAAIFR